MKSAKVVVETQIGAKQQCLSAAHVLVGASKRTAERKRSEVRGVRRGLIGERDAERA